MFFRHASGSLVRVCSSAFGSDNGVEMLTLIMANQFHARSATGMPCNEKQEANERKGTLTDHILLVLYATAVIDEAAKISWKSTSEEGFYLLSESNKNKRKHRDASSIILCICLMSVVLYLPIMSHKLMAMDMHLRQRTFFSERQVAFIQDIQQAAHLLCLAIRFVPYLIFDKRIHSWIHRMMGVRIPRKTPRTAPRRHGHQYRCRCHCSRPQSSLELNSDPNERNAQLC